MESFLGRQVAVRWCVCGVAALVLPSQALLLSCIDLCSSSFRWRAFMAVVDGKW